MPETFTIEYSKGSFAAFEADEVAKRQSGIFDPKIVWSYVGREKLLDRPIEGHLLDDFDLSFTGNVKILLTSLKSKGATIGTDFEIISTDAEHGGYQLPTANFMMEINVSNRLPGNVMAGLRWNANYVRKFNWIKELHREFLKGHRIAREIENNPEYKPPYEDERFYKDWTNTLHLIKSLDDGIEIDTTLDIIKQSYEKILPTIHDIKRANDDTGSARRAAIATAIARLSKKRHGFRQRPHPDVLMGAETLGKCLFKVFSHYMNKIFRYFKYEQMQYWLEEIRDSQEGYFFIQNTLRWRNTWELMPYGYHNIHLHFLKDDFSYLNSDDWDDAISVTNDSAKLDRYAEGFSLAGVFSQAYSSVIDVHFEQAVILGVIGLESVFKFILGDQRLYPHEIKGAKLKVLTLLLFSLMEPWEKTVDPSSHSTKSAKTIFFSK